jgi:Icc-related predicted phosphoesterase
MPKVFFSVDVHGASSVWRKWLNAVKHHNADVLMFCGDLTGKALVPLIEQPNGNAVAFYFGRDWILETEEEKRTMEKRLEDAGVYTIRAKPDQVDHWRQNSEEVNRLMAAGIEKRLRDWLELLLGVIDTKRVMAVVMPGNDDDFALDAVIKDYEDRGIVFPLGKVVSIVGFETISLAHTNPTPWDTPREADERQLARMIKQEVSGLKNPRGAIFNFHCPPYGTRLDLAPELDKNLRPLTVAGQISMKPVGSKAVREAILKYKPMLGLHGHIHESYGAEKLGETVILNPGSEYGEGILRAFVIEISEHGLESYHKVES